MWGDSSGWRLKDFDKRKAAFLTATFKPYRNTEIRVEGEYGNNSRQSGFTTLDDRLSGWDGKTVFNAPAGATTLPSNANALGVGPSRCQLLRLRSVFRGQRDHELSERSHHTPRRQQHDHPARRFRAGQSAFVCERRRDVLHAVNIPENRFGTAIANSFFRPPSEEFTISPDAPILAQRFKDLQVTLNQRLGNFYFEVAADINRSRVKINGEQNRSSNDTYIDINQVLPNGAPNPHFKQAYGDGSLMRADRKFDYNNVRGAAAYVLDTRWGNFAFNTLGGINRGEEDQDYRYLSVAQGDDHRQWGFLESTVLQTVRIRRYWNDLSRPIPDLSLSTIKYVDPTPG